MNIRLEPAYAEILPSFLTVFSKAGDSDSNVMATRMLHVLKSLREANVRNIDVEDFAALMSGYDDMDAGALSASILVKYGKLTESGSIDVYATGTNMRLATE